MSSKGFKFCCIAMINIVDKVTKEDVDNSHPDTALLYLKFEATHKTEQEKLSNLKLTFKGMRDEESVTITSDELQLMQTHNGMIHKDICYY